MVDVVGLRFVTEGEQQALRALELYRQHVAAANKGART